MFGKGKLLREGAQTQGVVIESRRTGGGGPADGTARLSSHVRVRVAFEDGSTVEIEHKLYGRLYVEGDIVPVRYDTHDHSKIEVDVPALEARHTANVDRAHEINIAHAEAALRPSGEDPRWLMKTMSAMHVARSAGNVAEYERLRAELEAWEAKTAGDYDSQLSVAAVTGSSPSSADRIDQLQRLAGLHASGVLTDAEFAAEKAKLLSQ